MNNKYRQYRQIWEAAFAHVEEQVRREAGREIQITEISLDMLVEVRNNWKNRPYQWNWFDLKRRFHHVPYRFEMAIHAEGRLCGLAIGKASRGKRHVSAYYIEGNPDAGHPLKRLVLPIVLASLERYAVMLGCQYIRLVNPLEGLMPRYRMLGFSEVARVVEGALYCERKC